MIRDSPVNKKEKQLEISGKKMFKNHGAMIKQNKIWIDF